VDIVPCVAVITCRHICLPFGRIIYGNVLIKNGSFLPKYPAEFIRQERRRCGRRIELQLPDENV
jgi:hypothetical protein